VNILTRALEKWRSLFRSKIGAAQKAAKHKFAPMEACGLHPEVYKAFQRALKPIERRRSEMESTSRGKNDCRPRFGRMVSDLFYGRDKHGALRRREPGRDKSLSFRTWRRARQAAKFASGLVVA
jgi:hypothetical protein